MGYEDHEIMGALTVGHLLEDLSLDYDISTSLTGLGRQLRYACCS